jgi:hypothetical protein
LKLLSLKTNGSAVLQMVTLVVLDEEGFTDTIATLLVLLPPAFVHTARYCLPLSGNVKLRLMLLLVAPVLSSQLLPLSVLICHCTVTATSLLAALDKITVAPVHLVTETGCKVIKAGILKLKGAAGTVGMVTELLEPSTLVTL